MRSGEAALPAGSFNRVILDAYGPGPLEQASKQANTRVLLYEDPSSDTKSVRILPHLGLYIGAVLVGALDDIAGNEQAAGFLGRLTDSPFGQAEFYLCAHPDPALEKQAFYRKILVRRIARIQIDRILEFTAAALQAIGAAA